MQNVADVGCIMPTNPSEQSIEEQLTNILETALRMQGVSKPVTELFNESHDEIQALVDKATRERAVAELGRLKEYAYSIDMSEEGDMSGELYYVIDADTVDKAVEELSNKEVSK